MKLFYSSSQIINSVGDQSLLLGEEGEKYRWFLLPSEAARLLSGKNPAHFPITPPFTPPQWKADTSILEGTNLNRTGCLKPCDEICLSTKEKCSLKSAYKSATSRENVNNLVVDSNCVVNGQIHDSYTGDVHFNNEKCDNYRNRDLSTFPDLGMANVVNLMTNGDAISLEAGKYYPANSEAENTDARQGENRVCVERALEISSVETGSCEFTKEENALENSAAKYIESSSNDFDKCPVSSTFDGARTTGLNAITNSSSENKMISENNDAVANSENVCRRKPRKSKQNEVTTGKPQFHHPPKNIFKPTVQVREY